MYVRHVFPHSLLIMPGASSQQPPTLPSSGGNLIGVLVNDHAIQAIKSRTWWHLRHLQEPIEPADPTGMSLLHNVPLRSQISSPSELSMGRRMKRRKPRSDSIEDEKERGKEEEDKKRDLSVLFPSTEVFFVYERYRVVFALDLSMSMFKFQGEVLPIDSLEAALERRLKVGNGHRLYLFCTVIDICFPLHAFGCRGLLFRFSLSCFLPLEMLSMTSSLFHSPCSA